MARPKIDFTVLILFDSGFANHLSFNILDISTHLNKNLFRILLPKK